jgi:hypothetical protein
VKIEYGGVKKNLMFVISWSFLKAFEQCPYQQKLIRIDKVVSKKMDERRFIAGSVGHRFFEVWAKRGFDDEITPKTVERILYIMSKRKYVVWRNKSDYEKVKERVINEASMIIEAVQHHGIDKLENIHVEKFFSKPLPCNQHSVAGKVDMVANNGTWLLEMKMSANPKWRDPEQLFFYGLLLGAIQRRYPRRLSFFLPVMPSVEDRLLDIEFSKDDFIVLYKRIQDLIEAWNKGDFPEASNLEACEYCTVKNHCKGR